MGTIKARFSRRRLLLGVGAVLAVAGIDVTGGSPAQAAGRRSARPQDKRSTAVLSDQVRPGPVHFQGDGGINNGYLVDQLAGNGQSIDNLAFITSAPGGNLELLGRGGVGTYVKLNYIDGGGTERTGVAVATGTDNPIISIAPEANGSATLDLENNTLTGVERVVPSPNSNDQMTLDGLLALTPQDRPATPASGGVLYVDAADGALKFIGRSGRVTTLARA